MKTFDQSERKSGYAFILIFMFMALGVMLTGYSHYSNYERVFRANVENQISSIAALKAGELALWRKERLGDGAILFKNRNFSALVRRFLETPNDTEAYKQLQEWMAKYTKAYQYAQVTLFDASGALRLLEPEDGNLVDLEISNNIPQILRDGRVAFQDFHREGTDSPIHLGVVVPIFDEADERRPLGVFLMDIAPSDYLYPFIARWPTPSQTAETLLVRRDGDDALFLNELRFKTNVPLTLRVPLAKTEVPAVKAVLGQFGTEEGVDYTGVPVIANVSAVPNSPWLMVSKISIAEAYAPVRERLWQTFILVSVMLSGAGVAMWLLWRQRNARYQEREKATEALSQSEARFHQLADATFEGVLITENGLILDANNSFLKMGGYEKAEEVIGRAALEFVAPEYREIVAGHMASGYDKPYEIVGVKRDGSTSHLEVRGRTMDIAGRRIRFTAVQDITERKKAELKADSMMRRNQVLMQNALEGVHILDEQGNLVEANDSFCRHLGYTMEEALQLSVIDWEAKYGADELQARMKAFLDSHAVFESVHRRKDGSLIDVEVSVVGVEFDGRKYLYATNRDITERKRAEEALRKSEGKYRTLVENIPQRIFYKDRNSVYVSCNKNYADYLRIGADEIVGKTDFDLHPKAFAEKYIADDQRLMGLGQTEEIEERYLEDGREKWAYTVKTPIRDDSGAVIGIQGIFWDITERKVAEESLRRSAKLLAEAQKVAKIGHWEWDIKSGAVTWSDELYRIFGYEPGAITPSMSALMDTVPPEDRERVGRIIDKSLYGTGRYFMDRVAVLPDGTRRIVHAEGEVERDESGAPLRMFAVVQDVTEKRKAESSVKLFREALNLSSDSIIVLDTETARPVDFNPAAYERLGYTRAEMLALTVFNIIVAEPGEFSWKERVRQVKESGGLIVERKHRKKNGSLIPVETSLSVAEVDGKEYMVAVVRDISERVKMREMEITAKSLALANRELEDFAHIASHDLQEPLRTIIAFSDRLEAKFGTEFDPKALDYLRRIRAAGMRMSQLMQDMLRYSLVSGGQLNFERVDLSQAVATVLEDLRGSIEESGARFDVGPLPVVNADPSQLYQLLQNLISNSIKYRKPGQPPNIKIGGTKTPMWDRGVIWEVVVEDDGIGFNNEYAQKIFKIFERLHGHSEYEGTGVGLATVSKIVQRHGWTIKAEGKPGEGAKFMIMMVLFEE